MFRVRESQLENLDAKKIPIKRHIPQEVKDQKHSPQLRLDAGLFSLTQVDHDIEKNCSNNQLANTSSLQIIQESLEEERYGSGDQCKCNVFNIYLLNNDLFRS